MENRLYTLMGKTHLRHQDVAVASPDRFPFADVAICAPRLNALVTLQNCSRDNLYYNTPCPWLQVKLLRLLQHFYAIGR
ncbi:hypothetical protein PsorP6_015576 [Peronosclerospora sorghi]|uniref:Uncharacterized protein n=1 Tax=Peronosclerospora sorghi TaxID=230839 RepID=A0ACC0WNF1_9STRA|nr:hypothetical protein PsorP6_015576 [Peronosclerospora sorghi]